MPPPQEHLSEYRAEAFQTTASCPDMPGILQRAMHTRPQFNSALMNNTGPIAIPGISQSNGTRPAHYSSIVPNLANTSFMHYSSVGRSPADFKKMCFYLGKSILSVLAVPRKHCLSIFPDLAEACFEHIFYIGRILTRTKHCFTVSISKFTGADHSFVGIIAATREQMVKGVFNSGDSENKRN